MIFGGRCTLSLEMKVAPLAFFGWLIFNTQTKQVYYLNTRGLDLKVEFTLSYLNLNCIIHTLMGPWGLRWSGESSLKASSGRICDCFSNWGCKYSLFGHCVFQG